MPPVAWGMLSSSALLENPECDFVSIVSVLPDCHGACGGTEYGASSDFMEIADPHLGSQGGYHEVQGYLAH